MPFYTRSELKSMPIYNSKATRTATYHKKSASVTEYIFLSHSHKDSDIVDQVVEVLGSQGAKIYVDWKDSSMPSVTSPETARLLKQKIAACNKFVLLATNNALASRWVPWELGIADNSNSMDNVVIMPVTDSPGSWQGNEYIGIYSRLILSDSGKPAVFAPGKTSGATLASWIRQ